ncbi:probable LRR receptor-like serine/threonine-protein kinase At1g06840 isoform X2 [Tripterygium wilfordii]|uniref:probable LRR receptor-like serine/threonine-protein kinase At1g06840 isoform X2 n=1 Tax=Tripterygium wilfordii TaxID=458696 RepID=UPI0018F82D19|nr:probable LRR receptor-like serine/threonine-protein kinase At1g06840 isoform X2 [Tripterygium wilfordii]
MLGQRVWGFIVAVSCGFFIVAIAQTTDPVEVKALRAVKSRLIDSMRHLRSWNRGDPCNSNWTGVLCFDTNGADGYLHVKELDFMWNELTGSIPKEVGNISSLRLLLLNGNTLSGSLPDELGYLASLNRLQVDSNHISGPVPKSFASLISVKHLHLNNNSISGQIPAEISKLPRLLHLLLDNNKLSGNLPPEFSNLSELRILQLDNNNFKGSKIPATYGNFSKLAKLSLRNCSLHGAIPDLSMIPNLIYLDLSWNQLTGNIPSNKLSDNMTTIYLSHNHLNGSVPESFSRLPFLQRLSLENNFLTGSVPANIWRNVSFSKGARLILDLRNNLLSNILGELNPPENVTLRLEGNPVCRNENILNTGQFCASESKWDEGNESSTNSTLTCPIYACPTDDFFEYVPASPVPCYCAAPLRIGYRLKSPSFSYFPQHISSFEKYLTSTLDLELYQLSINSFLWEAGPRLRMYLKIFPAFNRSHSGVFNLSEIQRIRGRYTSWDFPRTDFFGPYELLNFTLLGPYSNICFESQRTSISKGILAAIIVGAVVCVAVSLIVTLLVTRRHARYQHVLSRKHLSSKISMKIEGVKGFAYKEMVLATDNFNSSNQIGRGGYGIVYRGNLSDNTVVAIKRAEEGSLQGQKEFLTEIKLLSRLHHRNLVSLVGYCDEAGEQMLVYEYMPNGTLSDWLAAKAKQNLNFGIRLRIALGSAKGILYLHTEAHPPVFHRDIKASNILLDSHLNAKVADFGLSRLAPVPDAEGTLPNHVSTVVKGTPGYLDPEYFLTHKLTDKSDVYSLGVVFLELLTGMRPISRGKNIVREVNMAHKSGTMFSIIDSKMGSYPSECVDRFLNLALACCHDKPENRPPMLDVVRELENILKMMPETDFIFPESSSTHSGQSASSSYVNRDLYMSSDIVGSDLISDVTSTITPR